MRNSKTLSKKKQIQVAKWYLDHPKESYKKTAQKFGITSHQVRYYVRKYNELEYAEAKSEKENEVVDEERDRVRQELKEKGGTDLLDEAIIDVIAEIRSRRELELQEKLKMISNLTLSMQRIQKLLFVEALKKPDAKKVIALCKKIEPNLTEPKIIELWQEIELEK